MPVKTTEDNIMKTLKFLSMFLIAALALAGCIPSPAPVPPQVACVDFDTLAAGTQYGQPAGQAPGDVAFTTANGITVRVRDFVLVNGTVTFNSANIETAPVAFGSGQSIRTNNINLEFDFTGIGFAPSLVKFEFVDLGGSQDIAINGGSTPPFAGKLSAAPNPLNGVFIALSSASVPPPTAGISGTVDLKGLVKNLEIGGQEYWIDNVCAYK
jgi:hypothetical protein